MSVSIRFLGTAAFEIITEHGKRILIDPYLDENHVSPIKVATMEKPDLLLITHGAVDHLGDSEAIMKRFPDLIAVCGADVRHYLIDQGIDGDRLRAIPWGMMVEEQGIPIRPVESRHWSYIIGKDGKSYSSVPVGFIIYAGENARIYHTGDTAIFSDLKLIGELYRPNVGLINVGVPREHRGAAHGVPTYLTGEMDAHEAAMACEWLRLDYAIPCHHDDPELPEIKKFAQQLRGVDRNAVKGIKPVVLRPGESFGTGKGRGQP